MPVSFRPAAWASTGKASANTRRRKKVKRARIRDKAFMLASLSFLSPPAVAGLGQHLTPAENTTCNLPTDGRVLHRPVESKSFSGYPAFKQSKLANCRILTGQHQSCSENGAHCST